MRKNIIRLKPDVAIKCRMGIYTGLLDCQKEGLPRENFGLIINSWEKKRLFL